MDTTVLSQDVVALILTTLPKLLAVNRSFLSFPHSGLLPCPATSFSHARRFELRREGPPASHMGQRLRSDPPLPSQPSCQRRIHFSNSLTCKTSQLNTQWLALAQLKISSPCQFKLTCTNKQTYCLQLSYIVYRSMKKQKLANIIHYKILLNYCNILLLILINNTLNPRSLVRLDPWCMFGPNNVV